MESKIKDISLADWGRKELELAEFEMPGLMSCRKEFGQSKPLKDTKITGSLHMTIQTAALIETLQCLGADIRWCSCNIYSTQDHAAAAIVKNNTAVVFAWKNETLEEYWQCTLNSLCFPDGKGPNQIVDDGGDATLLLQLGLEYETKYKANKTLPDVTNVKSAEEIALLNIIKREILKDENLFTRLASEFKGLSEETTTGVLRLYQYEKEGRLLCPAINVNDSVTKSKFDNVYGCRHSLPDGLNRATDVMIAGKKVCVCGYGDVGKGCAQSMSAARGIVYVTEIDPINALQACMEGYQVKKLEDIISEMDFIITATGNKNVVTLEHMKMMKHNAILGNIGHFDNEIDMYSLENCPGVQAVNIKPQLDKYIFPDGKAILILAQGRLLNLGCATGHPSFVMSNSFTNQTLAQIELKENFKTKKYENKVYVLPKELDEKVAMLHLGSMKAQLTVLTKEQSDYIGVPINGPFKKQEYKY